MQKEPEDGVAVHGKEKYNAKYELPANHKRPTNWNSSKG